MSDITHVATFLALLVPTCLFDVGCAVAEPPLGSPPTNDATNPAEAGAASPNTDTADQSASESDWANSGTADPVRTAASNDAASSEIASHDAGDAVTAADVNTHISQVEQLDAATTADNLTEILLPDGSLPQGASPDSGLGDERLCARVCASSAPLPCANESCQQYCVDQLVGFREECAALYRKALECQAARDASEFGCDEYNYLLAPEACLTELDAVGRCIAPSSN